MRLRRAAWGIFLAGLLIGAGAAALWLRREIPRRLAAAEASARQEAARLGLRLSFGRLAVRLIAPNVSLESVEVADAASGLPLLRAERIDATLSFRSLLFGEGRPLSRVRVRGFALSLSDGNRGALERALERRDEKAGEIPEIVLLEGTIRLGPLGAVGAWEAFFPEIRIRRTALMGTRVNFSWEGAKGTVRLPGISWGAWPYATAAGDLSYKEGRLRVRRLAARGDYASVRISGIVEPQKQSADLSVSGDADLRRWIAAGAPGAAAAPWIQGGRLAFSLSLRGSLREPAGTARLVWKEGRLGKDTAAEGEVALAAAGGKIRIESLKGRLFAGALSGSGEYDFRAGEGAMEASLRQAALEKMPWDVLFLPVHPAGKGDVTIRLAGRPFAFSAAATLSCPEGFEASPSGGFSVKTRLPFSLAGRGRVRAGREVAIEGFSVRLGGAEAAGSGRIAWSLRDASFAGTLSIAAGRASDFGIDFGLSWRQISGTWEAAGEPSRPRFSARIEGGDLALNGLPGFSPILRVEGEAGGAVHFVADAASPAGLVTASGTVTGPLCAEPFHLEATVTARDVDLSQAGPWGRALLTSTGGDPAVLPAFVGEMGGAASASIRLAAGRGLFSLSGVVEVPQLRLKGAPVQGFRLEGEWEKGGSRPGWRAAASGGIAGGSFRARGHGTGDGGAVEIEGEGIDVGRAAEAAGARWGKQAEGAASLALAAELRGGKWMVSRLALSSPEISFAGTKWRGVVVSGSLDAASGRLVASARSPAVSVAVDLRRAPGWPASVTFRAEDVPVSAIAAAGGGAAAGAEGSLSAEGSSSVRAGDLFDARKSPVEAIEALQFAAVARALSFSGVTLGGVSVQGRKEKDALRGEIRTAAPESSLSYSLALREPFPFTVEGSFGLAAAGGFGQEAGNGGVLLSLSGRAAVEGALRAIERASGTLRVAQFRFRRYGVDVVGRDLAALLDSTGVRLDGGILEAAGNPLRVSGRVSWKGELDLRAAGKFPAAAVRMATDVFDRLEGTIRGEVRIAGPWRNFAVVGTARLDGGSFSFRGYAQSFEEMTAEAVISREKIIFEHFEGRSGGGYVDGWGEVPLAFDAGQRFYFSVDFFDVRYPYPDDLRPVLQGHVEVLGPLENLLVTGDVEVQSARYTRPLRPEKSLVDFRRRVSDVAARRGKDEFRVRLDIEGVADGTIRVRNNLADVQAKGEFRVVGDSSRPIVLGSFEAVEGTVEYRGNKYEIRRLSVDFQDPRRNNPRIDARAETRKGSVTITVSVTGTLDKYEVEFASDPPLSKNSIVSLLSLGVPAEALAGAEGTVGAGAAASIALGPYKGRVEEEIRGIVGLDKFAIEPAFSSASKSFESRFTVGKDFGDRFSVSFSTNVGGSSPDTSAAAEFKLGENVFLQGAWQSATTTREGDVGGDVKFRYRYRQFKDFLRRGGE